VEVGAKLVEPQAYSYSNLNLTKDMISLKLQSVLSLWMRFEVPVKLKLEAVQE
jgi:hypothetical protein